MSAAPQWATILTAAWLGFLAGMLAGLALREWWQRRRDHAIADLVDDDDWPVGQFSVLHEEPFDPSWHVHGVRYCTACARPAAKCQCTVPNISEPAL